MSLLDDRDDTDYFLSRVTGTTVEAKPKRKTSGLSDGSEGNKKRGFFKSTNDESETDQLLITAPETAKKRRGRLLLGGLSIFLIALFGAGTVLFYLHTKALAHIFPEGLYGGIALGGLGILTGIIGLTASLSRSVVVRIIYLVVAVLSFLACLTGLAFGILGGTALDRKLEDRWHHEVNTHPEDICHFESHYECSGWLDACDNTTEMVMEALYLDSNVSTNFSWHEATMPPPSSSNVTSSDGSGSSDSGGSSNHHVPSLPSHAPNSRGGNNQWLDIDRLAASAQVVSVFENAAPALTEAPADHTEAPADHTEAPADHTEAPADHTEAPADHTEAPADHTEAPGAHTSPTTPAPQPAVHSNVSNGTNSTNGPATSEPEVNGAPQAKTVRCALCLAEKILDDDISALIRLNRSDFDNLHTTTCAHAFEKKVKSRMFILLGAIGGLLLIVVVTCMLAWNSRAQIVEASIPIY